MSNFLQLALMAAQAVAAMKSSPPPGRAWCRIAGVASMALCLLIASGFLLAALWLFLEPRLGAIQTALLIAALLALKATVIALLLRYWRPTRKASAPIEALPVAELMAVFNTHKMPALLAALAAGVIAGTATHRRP